MYGHPRYTGDIDFWVEAILDNGNKLVNVFESFGLAEFGLKAEDFAKDNQVIQIGYPPFRIDVLTSISGVEFEEAYANKNSTEIDGLMVDFIGLNDLKINKLAAGRPKDLEDLRNLE